MCTQTPLTGESQCCDFCSSVPAISERVRATGKAALERVEAAGQAAKAQLRHLRDDAEEAALKAEHCIRNNPVKAAAVAAVACLAIGFLAARALKD